MRNQLNYFMTTNRTNKNSCPAGHDDGPDMPMGKMPMIATMPESQHPILSRTIIFDQEINDMTATALRAEVLSKSAEDPEAPIFLLLSSPGGGLYESLGIYDTFQLISNPIVAICTGKVMSGGIVILLGCDVRLSTPNNTFMIHHGHTMLAGNVIQLEEQLNEIKSLNDRMLDIIIKKTNISREQLKTWLVKDHYMNSTDAVKHGLIDAEITSFDEIVVTKELPIKHKVSEADLEKAMEQFASNKATKKPAKKVAKKKKSIKKK